jgi:O-antigen/teichoic acid export membrane protein
MIAAASRTRKVLALSAGKAMASVLNLATTAVLARVLSQPDMATYRQTFLVFLIAAPLLQMGIGESLYYFLPTEKERPRGRVLDAMFLLSLQGLAFALFLACGGSDWLARRFHNPDLSDLLPWLIPYAILSLPSGPLVEVMVARNRVGWAAAHGVLRQLVIAAASLLPLFWWNTPKEPIIGHVLASILMALVAMALMIRATPPGGALPSLGSLQEMARFAVPLGAATMVGTLTIKLDKLVVGFFSDPIAYVIYDFGAMEIPLIAVITGSITSVMVTEMRSALVAGEKEKAIALFRLSAEKSSMILFPVMFFFLVAAVPFVETLYGKAYTGSALPFRIYLLLLPVRTAVFAAMLVAMGENRFLLQRALVELGLNLVLSVALVKAFGPWGAAASTVLVVMFYGWPVSIGRIARKLGIPAARVIPWAHFRRISLHLLPMALACLWLTERLSAREPGLRLAAAALLFWPMVAGWLWFHLRSSRTTSLSGGNGA